MLEKIFFKLGLSPKDLQIYLRLATTGTNKASEIALELELPKTTVLESLYKLEKEGLVSKITKGNKFIFSAQDPEMLKMKIKNQLEELNEIQQNIDQAIFTIKQKQNKKKLPKVKFFQGRNGIIQIYEQTLQSIGRIYAYGDFNSAKNYLKEYLEEYWKKRTAKRINLTAFIPDSLVNRQISKNTDNSYLRTSYFYPARFQSSVEINVYQDTVTFVSFEEEIAVSIESRSIANSITNLLDTLKEKLPS
jgi:sugar-specific transcriptional regulator TrmB